MAVKIGQAAQEGSFKIYKGVAGFNIVAVNPNKEELSKLTGREVEKEPEYLMKTEDGVPQVRVVFYARTAQESQVNNGIQLLLPISFIITNAPNVGAEGAKCQVIDKFGRTAWVTKEEFAEKKIPTYTSGPANISADYRRAFKGEEFLVGFIKQWLNIPEAAEYKNKQWVEKADQSDCEVSLNIETLLKGDVKELRELVNAAPNFIVKGAVGVRVVEGENGPRMYQSVYNRKFVKNSVTDYSKLDADIASYQSRGGNPNTTFSVLPLHEHKAVVTEFKQPAGNTEAPVSSSPTPWD